MIKYVNKCYLDAGEQLLDEFGSILPEGMESLGEYEGLSGLGVDKLLSEIYAIANGAGSEIISFFLLLFGIGVLIAVASLVRAPYDGIVSGGVAAVSSFAIFMSIRPLYESVFMALGEINSFFSALMPVIASGLALGGAVNTSGTAAVGMQITLWLVGTISEILLTPLIAAIIATAASASFSGIGAGRVSKGIKNAFTKSVGAVGTVISAVLALQTSISAAGDSAIIRAAKYAAGNMIPVVGSAVSGALSTVTGGLLYAESIIGVGSIVAIVSIALSPLVLLLLYKLCFYVVGLFLEFATKSGGVSCISGFSGAIDAMIAVYSMTIIVYILEIVMLVGGGASLLGGL